MTPAITATLLLAGILGAVLLFVGWVWFIGTRIQKTFWAFFWSMLPALVAVWIGLYISLGGTFL